MKFRTFLVAALAAVALGANAQSSPKYDFSPYWTIGLQGGAATTYGEHLKWSKTVSPAAALSVGYRFSRPVGLRLHASGWEAKNGWTYEHDRMNYYKWNYGQLGLDAMIDLNTIFSGYNPNRCFTVYGILGVGYVHGFNNDDAHTNKYTLGHPGEMTLIWEKNKLNALSGRAGVQLDFRLSQRLSLNLEGLTTVTSDKFNSKKGDDNLDWLFNAYVGVKYRLGDLGEAVAPAVLVPAPVVTPVVEEVKEEEVVVEPAPVPVPVSPSNAASTSNSGTNSGSVSKSTQEKSLTRNVFFLINSAKVRPSEVVKVNEVVNYLKQNPKAKVSITGYADRGTGNAVINSRLSKQRANAVFAALVKRNIAASRIIKDAKGDTVQPFADNDQNRVVICIAE